MLKYTLDIQPSNRLLNTQKAFFIYLSFSKYLSIQHAPSLNIYLHIQHSPSLNIYLSIQYYLIQNLLILIFQTMKKLKIRQSNCKDIGIRNS